MVKNFPKAIVAAFLFLLLVGMSSIGDSRRNLPLTLEDSNAKPVTIGSTDSSYHTLLLFWTTWCPYCRESIVALKGRYAELRKNNVEVFAVNVKERPRKAGPFIKANNLPYPVLFDRDGSAAGSMGIVGIPTFILIDKNGDILFKGNYFPEDEYKKLIREE